MESFEQLAKQYEPMIHKIINTLNIFNRRDEFYQHGLVALWEASNSFNSEKGTFTNYAYTFIRGRMLTELNNLYKDLENTICPKEEYWETIEDTCPVCPFEKEILLTYCETMTPKQRLWVLQRFINGYSDKEIAEIENVSISAVKNWRMGAKEKVREWMKSDVN
ncbi:sigma-70 family RNA polymerase sigma factor [Neobacillus sp. LXY-1]|uniref:sigma-70 family RNA polymerase sigma factor n=1 Tax=Neobacillus sp. LXY-1 TaxID=3379133 RepID=UPI003EE0AF48